jgi:hypothetical protein
VIFAAGVRLAHEAALASQKLFLDAAGLVQTFERLQQLVRELQGICARKVDLTDKVLEPLFPDMSKTGGMQEMPEDLRRLKEQVCELHVQSTGLKELPDWIGELVCLETLDLGSGKGKKNKEMTQLPECLYTLGFVWFLTAGSAVRVNRKAGGAGEPEPSRRCADGAASGLGAVDVASKTRALRSSSAQDTTIDFRGTRRVKRAQDCMLLFFRGATAEYRFGSVRLFIHSETGSRIFAGCRAIDVTAQAAS